MLINLSQHDILRRYPTFDELCEALDTCFDLEDLGYADKVTQENYIELSEMKALALWGMYRQAHSSP